MQIPLQWIPRKQQVFINEEFKKSVENDKKFFVVEAPVGIGKSYAIVMMAEYFDRLNGGECKFDVITNTKILQEQYLRDFSFMKEIKGSENYSCSKHNTNCGEGMDLCDIKNVSCTPCAYKTARREYLESKIGVLNFHMFINYWMYTEDMMNLRGSKVLFVDEAHSFEETYCDFVDAHISKEYLEELGVWKSEYLEQLPKIRNVRRFANFVQKEIKPVLEHNIKKLIHKISSSQTPEWEKKIALSEQKKLKRVQCKYNRLLNDIDNIDNWVLEVDKNENEPSNPLYYKIKVEAVWASKYLKELWDKYDKVVFLSGTIGKESFFSRLMGYERKESSFITVESPFPIENRKVYYNGIDNISYKRKSEAFENIYPYIEKALKKHSDVKGIIHTSNYEIASWIKNKRLKDERLIFHDARTRENALGFHIITSTPTVLVSPSMINGVDLKDDLSRFQIIVKIPFPNLSSIKVKRRMEEDNQWYKWKTICDVTQAYGRSTRSETDYSVTYIFDKNFDLLLRSGLPKYLKEAIER